MLFVSRFRLSMHFENGLEFGFSFFVFASLYFIFRFLCSHHFILFFIFCARITLKNGSEFPLSFWLGLLLKNRFEFPLSFLRDFEKSINAPVI